MAVVSVASGDVLEVRQFSVHERLSSLFLVSLVVVSENVNVDFNAVVGQAARFAFERKGHTRSWSGLCNRFEQIGFEDSGLAIYHMNVVPQLWLTTQRRNYRMFQQQSELDIVTDLLTEWGITPEKKLSSTYKKRKYRVQYGETDFAFISRMLEDAGITFYFEQSGDESKLVLSDAPQTNEPRADKIAFREGTISSFDKEQLAGVRIGKEVRSGKYTMRDHDYRKPPEYELLATAEDGSDLEQSLERFHYTPGAFLFGTDKGPSTPVADDRGKTRSDEGEAKTLARKRLDAKRGSVWTCTFETNVIDLAPGVVMSILDHPRAELGPNEKLLVLESTMSGSLDNFTHACEVKSAAVAYRPPLRTRKPKAMGVESATVVGPKGEEIHTDEFGRVRVHFHWDRLSKMDEKSSCWIHVSQSWAGAGFGTTHLPRVGQEVLVDFLSADPDRPIIVGRVYTDLQKTPYKLPDHKTQTGWKSNSTGKTGGYNEIMFEDQGGKELVRMQAEKDLTKLVKHNESITIGNDRSKSVGHDDSLSVGNDRSRMVGNNESVTIGADQTITVGANQTVTVGVDQTETVMGNRTFTLVGNLTETITGTSTLTQTGDQTVTLMANRTENIIGDMTLLNLGTQTEIQAGSRTLLQLGGKTEIRLGNETHVQLGGETEVRVGASTRIQVGPQTETVTAVKTINTPTLNVNADIVAAIRSALIQLIATGLVQIDGATVSIGAGAANVIASGETTIKGSVIKLNC